MSIILYNNIKLLRVLFLASLKLPTVFHRDLYYNLFSFFLLYVNDMANAVLDLNVQNFAADTKLFIGNKDPFLHNSTANAAINQLNKLVYG